MKATGGGRFDPNERGVYFVAGGRPIHCPYVLVATNDLMTDGAVRTELVPHLERGAKVLLDSGIFFITQRHKRAHPGMSMDDALALPPDRIDGFAELYERYVYLARTFGDDLWGYAELDQGGKENKRVTRAKLEDLGLAPMPVYHPLNDGWDYFDELASTYDRMCFGNMVQAHTRTRVRLLMTLWERHRDYPDLWVHVLGATPNEHTMAMPFDSSDSSTWTVPLRWPWGPMTYAGLKTFERLPRPWQWVTGGSSESIRRAEQACEWQILGPHTDWQSHLAATRDALGLPLYPPRIAGELEPAPGKVAQ